MLPPETMQTMRPVPARPESAAATASAPAPSATTFARSASTRTAAAVSSSVTVCEPDSRGCASFHIFGSSSRLPAPSTNDGT